jgi:peptidoglycan hydrolase CwlO-like protein
MTGSELRRLKHILSNTCSDLSKEIEKNQKYQREIMELNREIEKIQKEVREANEKYSGRAYV